MIASRHKATWLRPTVILLPSVTEHRIFGPKTAATDRRSPISCMSRSMRETLSCCCFGSVDRLRPSAPLWPVLCARQKLTDRRIP